jgi:uncharacterized protein (DUF2236 family)
VAADSAVDPYGDVSGLVERSAASYAASVPEQPADDGFFGPRSVTWRLSTDLSGVIAGLRSLMVQALHPLAMAGVDQHSNWRQDPVGRLAATQSYVTTVSVGDRATAERVSARVRRIHEHVRGTDPVTGQPYAAGDPGLLLWVHAALVDSAIVAARMFGTGLPGADADRYVAEMVAAAELIGIPAGLAPASVAALDEYLDSVRPVLQATPAARESMAYLLDPPGLDPDVAGIWCDIREGAIASLPSWARDQYGYRLDAPLTGERRTEIRQALGVLDTVFLAEPGVLEARQRLALRMRAARAA